MNVFDLQAKLSLNAKEFRDGLNEASKDVSAVGEKLKIGFGAITKAGAAAIGAAATGITALVKQSVSAYAEYEQLVGGIETLFGDSAEKVIENADKAFATAGLSASEYMDTAINFSGALLKSLEGDTEKAAELTQTAILDMSDQANKYGRTVSEVSATYTSLARGNYQTLDNLFGGMFAGTKAGLQEMLETAEAYRASLGETVSYSSDSYADIVSAIHDISEMTGVMGTTSAEAAGTITGSIGSMKAAWKNLVVEMAKSDGDVEAAFQILGDNVSGVIENMMPKVEQALGGVGDLIVAAAPQITSGLKRLLPKVLPSVLKTATSLVGAVGQGVLQAFPDLLSAGTGLLGDLYSNFKSSDFGVFNWLKEDAVRVIDSITGTFKELDFDSIKKGFSGLLGSIGNTLEKVGDKIVWTTENIISPLIEWAGNDIIPTFFEGLGASIDIATAAVELFKTPALAVWDGFLKPLAEGAGDLIYGSLDLISKGLGYLADEFDDVDWSGYWEDISNGEFFANWKRGWDSIKDSVSEGSDAIDDFFDVNDAARAWNGIWQEVGGRIFDIKEGIVSDFAEVKATISDFVDLWKLGAESIGNAADTVCEKIGNFIDTWKLGLETIQNYKNERKSDWKAGIDTLEGFGFSIYDFIHPDSNAIGNYIASPTITAVAEKEPEYIIPESKMDKVYPRNSGNIIVEKIIIEGYNVQNDEHLGEVISEKLAELSVRQQRALGGVGW